MRTPWSKLHTRYLLFITLSGAVFGLLSALLPLVASPSQVQSRLGLCLDYALFRASDQRPYLEIYYSLPQSQLRYVSNPAGGFLCQVVMALQIFHEETLWATKLWKIEKTINDTAEIGKDSHLVDMLRYVLEKTGLYRITLHVKDLNQQKLDSALVTFEAYPFSQEKLEISDLEFATQIRKLAPDSTGVFVKNTMEVIPNPALLFGESSPTLYYYYEGYNLLKNIPGNKYKTRCLIKDSGGRTVEGIMNPDHTKMKKFEASVEMGMVSVSGLPSGVYTFFYGIADSAGQLLTGREKKFYIYNPSVSPVAQQESGPPSPFGTFGPLDALSEQELDKEFAQMQYVTGKDDRKFYNSLQNDRAKREFIFSLWARPRPEQTGTAMAVRQQYLERVEQADKEFGTALRVGWKSDRGRVYITYGPPSTIERYSSSSEQKPYEVWVYQELEGGASFVFADRYGFKNYELIHSTLRGEISNPNWQDLIKTGVDPFRSQ